MNEPGPSFYVFLLVIVYSVRTVFSIESAEDRAEENSENDSTVLLMVIGLLIATVLTIWLFKAKRFRFLHETGLCMLYGILAGLVVKYTGGNTQTGHAIYVDEPVAPLTLWVNFTNASYSYRRQGILHTKSRKGGSELETKAVFDPNVFFYALLPPIIFYAGYSMKKRFFFRNLGAILTYAFIGTTISCLVFAGIIYGFVSLFGSDKYDNFQFHDSLLFGSLISATDPVTVLAIFHDLNVEVDLYAIVFGESVLNDAVAIVLYRTIQSYKNATFHSRSIFQALGSFILVFGGSLALGTFMGLLNALLTNLEKEEFLPGLTKLTRIGQFPQLETALFVLMSYSSFLIAEAAKLTGIVTVLFCGIAQAHYTYNNLTPQSQIATKELAIAISRFCNIYPLSFLLNLKRSKKIPWRFQHMLFFAGLRGAVAFALAIKNTETIPRQLMLTSALMVAIVTVIFNGGLTTQALLKLGIRVNVDPDEDITRQTSVDERGGIHEDISYERSWLVRHWHQFDVKYMKPLFTNRGGPVSSVLPACCQPFAAWLSSAINSEGDEHRRRSDAQMDEIGSIDDEMIDVSSEVMTRSPRQQTSQDNLVQEPDQRESRGTDIPLDIVT